MSEKKAKKFERGPDRRRKHVDPKDLPFPDRRKADRRVFSEEEREEFLKRVKIDEDIEE